MSTTNKNTYNRRLFLTQSSKAALFCGLRAGIGYAGRSKPRYRSQAKKVIVIGIDGMDPGLARKMIAAEKLPNFARMQKMGGFSSLATTIPPQSPVAWASFINGAGPGSHGIFDFIHRDPLKQAMPYYSAAVTVPGQGGWEIGKYKIPLEFWPFNDIAPHTVLRRQGVPFWDYLDDAGIDSVFYWLPSDYPPSPSRQGHHKCLSGLGVPDMLGTFGTYQHFAEDGPIKPRNEGGGRRSMLSFAHETARAVLLGPPNSALKQPKPVKVDFLVHRDRQADAGIVQIQGRKILLKSGQWSPWIKLDFIMTYPGLIPDKTVSGICRFYLQEVSPNFRLYVSPININPEDPAIQMSEPAEFITAIARERGLFYTTGFQEDHKALSNKIFSDDEYVIQAGMVLDERLALLEYALRHYHDGLLYFYFSSTDLQSHMFWWNSTEQHPVRTASAARHYFGHLQKIYQKIDQALGMILSRYGNQATIIAISDHGFANFRRQFNLNTWLGKNGFLGPGDATGVLEDVDWSMTRAYGMGLNGLYLNLKGRERYGIVEPGKQKDDLLEELSYRLAMIRDVNGQRIIRQVYRSDKVYTGKATGSAPDLIIGYKRGYRSSWSTCLGNMKEDILSDNTLAWSADHCLDVNEVPGVLFCNRSFAARQPSLIDIAPSILYEFGIKKPSSMTGNNIFV